MKAISLIALATLATKANADGPLKALQPSWLAEESYQMLSVLGNFGSVNQGQTLMGTVVYPDLTNLDGCLPFTQEQFQDQQQVVRGEREGRPLFILVNSGGCSNPHKVRNVENFGGALAIIADYMSEDDDSDSDLFSSASSGHSLVTPGILVDEESGEMIKKACDEDSVVVMRASLSNAKPDNEVEVGLLYSSSLDLDAGSMQAFGVMALESAQTRHKALLDLHIHTFSCPKCTQEVKTENCLSDGKYCAFFPKVGDQDFKVEGDDEQKVSFAQTAFTGRELLESSLQEKCYHKELKDIIELGGQDNYDLELNFIKQMVTRLAQCERNYSETKQFLKQCLFDTDATQIPKALQGKIKSCVERSFKTKGDRESNNRMLEADARWVKEHHLDIHPSITVNDMTFLGSIDFVDIREAICRGYQTRPQHCRVEEIWRSKKSLRPLTTEDTKVQLEHKKNAGTFTSFTLNVQEMLSIVFVVIVVNCFIWLYFQRKTRLETTDNVNQRVSAAIHEYFALSDHDATFDDF